MFPPRPTIHPTSGLPFQNPLSSASPPIKKKNKKSASGFNALCPSSSPVVAAPTLSRVRRRRAKGRAWANSPASGDWQRAPGRAWANGSRSWRCGRRWRSMLHGRGPRGPGPKLWRRAGAFWTRLPERRRFAVRSEAATDLGPASLDLDEEVAGRRFGLAASTDLPAHMEACRC
jgi:hypothetical protein